MLNSTSKITDNSSSIADFASKFINHTNKHIFLTGKAGTGKTTFLKHIIHHTHKNVIVAAPTGIAAINAGGVTLHSLFQLPFGSFIPSNGTSNFNENQQLNTPATLMRNSKLNKNKRRMLQELELLIIDEVSMLRADLLDAIDTMLRSVKRNRFTPFGGVQLLLIGDLLQLPPVVKDNEWYILKSYYKSIYFFDALALKDNPPLQIELNKIYRQADERFINLLNNLRNNTVTPDDIELLENHYSPSFQPKKDDGFIRLTTHNRQADQLNKEELDKLTSKPYSFTAKVSGDFSEYNYPVDEHLILKKGAQVMFIKNDPSGQRKFFNGKIGTITNIDSDGIEVTSEGDDYPIEVEKYEWENVKYKLDEATNQIEENVVGKFIQYPLRLAWAITVHKSQGLTFTKAIIDVGNAFASGQVYVALSRLTGLEGLVLTSSINQQSLQLDETITQFSRTKADESLLPQLLENEAQAYFLDFLLKSYDLSSLSKEVQYHVESYSKDEKKSAKQQYVSWAKELKAKVDELLPVSVKFKYQIQQIIQTKNTNYKTTLLERVKAANTYFIPILESHSKHILNHITELSVVSKIKIYLSELKELEAHFFKQIGLMKKAEILINSSIENKEFTKEMVKNVVEDDHQRTTLVSSIKITKEKTPKKDKIDTKKLSFDLYKQGKSIPEIAKERSLVEGTITGHLAYYVGLGMIDVKELVDEQKFKAIEELYLTNKDIAGFGAFKANLSDDFTYGDIKLVVAFLQNKKTE